MIKQTSNNIEYFRFEEIKATHFYTTRTVDMHEEKGKDAHAKLAQSINAKYGRIVFPDQKHTAKIGEVNEDNYNDVFPMTDALITNIPGAALGVVTADCVPVLLHDEANGVIAAIHAGWRGTSKEICKKTAQKMIDRYGADPKKIKAGIGPSISANVYEVGKEVLESFTTTNANYQQFFSKKNNGKFLLDLWTANFYQLIAAGLEKNAIRVANLCTFTQNDLFFSARKEKLNVGRNAAIIKND